MPNNKRQENSTIAITRKQEFARTFRNWERHGRGSIVFDYDVELEPQFSRLTFSRQNSQVIDDARKQSRIGRLFSSNKTPITNNPVDVAVRFQSPDQKSAVDLASFQINLPDKLVLSLEQSEQFLNNLAHSSDFVGFEIIATSREISFQITCPKSEKQSVFSKLKHHLPFVNVGSEEDLLKTHIKERCHENSLILDFGFAKEWFIPLPSTIQKPDLLLPLIASLENLADDEFALLQILFSRVRYNWQEATKEVIYNRQGKLRFPHLKPFEFKIGEKLSNNILAGQIRLLIQSESPSRSREVAKDTRAFFLQFSSPNANELIPLNNDCLDSSKHLQSILSRTSYRSGILLSPQELSSIVHLPTNEIRSKKLKRDENPTRLVPRIATGGTLVLGENHHLGRTTPVTLSDKQRVKHQHSVGSSGSGKSTHLIYQMNQDLELGNGFICLDPHGDLIDMVMERVPDNRLEDVIVFDPADEEFPIGFNILSAHSELEKTLLSSDLVAIFKRFSTSWGDQMNSVLANAVLAFLESEKGGNLLDMKRFLVERTWREEFLETVQDEEIKYYWRKEFPVLKGNPYAPLLTRLDAFLRSKLIRHIVAQKENKLDFRKIMDEKKILLVRLSVGAIGEENAYLLGSLIVTKLHLATLSRQDIAESKRSPFFCYLDEAHQFISPSMNQILSGVRKYKLGLILAHQNPQQFQSSNGDILDSVLSNCYTRICFRLDDKDADRMAKGFSFFTSDHLKNLGVGEAIARFEQSRFDFNLKTFMLPSVEPKRAKEITDLIVEHSRKTYAKPKAEVEAELNANKSQDLSINRQSIKKPKNEGVIYPTRQFKKGRWRKTPSGNSVGH